MDRRLQEVRELLGIGEAKKANKPRSVREIAREVREYLGVTQPVYDKLEQAKRGLESDIPRIFDLLKDDLVVKLVGSDLEALKARCRGLMTDTEKLVAAYDSYDKDVERIAIKLTRSSES